MATVFTSAGEAFAADLWDGSASAPSDYYIAWGTGSGSAAKANTALATEASESRVAATASQPSADVNRFVAELTAEGPKTITEVGLFTASTNGTMPVRSDFAGVALDTGDKIEFTIEIEWT